MFFYLSKFFWFLVNPGNMFLFILIFSIVLLFTRWNLAGRRILVMLLLIGGFIAVDPVSGPLLRNLEEQFPPVTQFPEKVDGIIVAGGVVSPVISHFRGKAAVGSNIERLFGLIDLGKRYPDAKIIFSAGAGNALRQEYKEAHYIRPLLERMGFQSIRVLLEDQSRNTIENAQYSFDIAKPKPSDKWFLVTSAFHMPRAMGVFRKAGWNVIAYPVDYRTLPSEASWTPNFNFTNGLGSLSNVLHEYLGLLFYRLTEKIDSFFPGPQNVK